MKPKKKPRRVVLGTGELSMPKDYEETVIGLWVGNAPKRKRKILHRAAQLYWKGKTIRLVAEIVE